MPQSISVWKMFSGIHNSSNQNLSANDSKDHFLILKRDSFLGGATVTESTPAIPKNTKAITKIFHNVIFSYPTNALAKEYFPVSFLLAFKIIPNSMGNIVNVPMIQNNNKLGIFIKYPSTKYTTLNTSVGINIDISSSVLFMVFIQILSLLFIHQNSLLKHP